MTDNGPDAEDGPQRALNIPDGVLAILLAMVFLHVLTTNWLSPSASTELAINTLFFASRYVHDLAGQGGAYFWSFVTYSFFHAGWMHLGLNAFWLAAFGSVVERRIGIVRLALFWIAASAVGALAFLVSVWGSEATLLGASGAIAGLMGAAARFAFRQDRRFSRGDSHLNRRLSLGETLANRSAAGFSLVYLGLNVLVPAVVPGMNIAWEAHLGGFVFGLLVFPVFDPRR